MEGSGMGKAMGEAPRFLFVVAGFGLMFIAGGVGLALWSIWLPIQVWQAVLIMGAFGLFGAFLAWRMP